MSDKRLFLVAGGGVLVGGLTVGLLFGNISTSSPLGALLLATAIAGGGAVLLNRVIPTHVCTR